MRFAFSQPSSCPIAPSRHVLKLSLATRAQELVAVAHRAFLVAGDNPPIAGGAAVATAVERGEVRVRHGGLFIQKVVSRHMNQGLRKRRPHRPAHALIKLLPPRQHFELRLRGPSIEALLQEGGCIYLIAPSKQPHPAGLVQMGLAPDQIVWIETSLEEQTLRPCPHLVDSIVSAG